MTVYRELGCNCGCTPDCEDSHGLTLSYLSTSNLYKLHTDEGDLWFNMDEWKALLEMIAEIGDAGSPLKPTQ